tara:strand:+ start:378 stop:1265 length:888 start_codon:yes stop_codon:yes gene_type:complete
VISLKKCPICEEERFNTKTLCIDHTVSKEEFSIVSCETCGFHLTNPRPPEEKMSKYYESEKYISHTNNSKGLFNWLYQTIRAYTIKRKVALLKKTSGSGLHLDIGCGTGEFLNACKKSGFETEGIEPSKIAREQAAKNYSLIVKEDTDLSTYKSSKFDSISMWHVLEHISSLNDSIAHLHRILKPGGKLIVAVPNHKSWDSSYYKKNWAAWDVPIHLWHFCQNTITALFKKHKFNLIKIKPMLFDSYYVSLLSEEITSGKKNFFKALAIGSISNAIGAFTKRGYSSAIYIFEKKN